MNDNVVIVTGASSGIGRETARIFAQHGWITVLAARRQERLEQIARECDQLGGRGVVFPTDVSDQSQVERLIGDTAERFGRIDVLVNNAGYGIHARIHETREEQMRAIFETNFFGVFHACRAVVPIMLARGGGHIFNVSSVIGKRGSPFNGAYSATKFALCGMDDSMRVELREQGIHVTTVCPGLTDTEFFDRVDRGDVQRAAFKSFRSMQSPEHVARKIFKAVGRYTPEMVFTPGGKFLVVLSTLSPRMADFLMAKYYHAQIKAEKAIEAL